MKAGERITCPHCGENTIVKLKPKMDGWTRVGDVLSCAFCGAELGTPEKNAPSASKKSSALAALLGEELSAAPSLAPGEGHKRFCRNCKNLIEHPFLLRCARDGREVDPGGCCEHFTLEEKP